MQQSQQTPRHSKPQQEPAAKSDKPSSNSNTASSAATAAAPASSSKKEGSSLDYILKWVPGDRTSTGKVPLEGDNSSGDSVVQLNFNARRQRQRRGQSLRASVALGGAAAAATPRGASAAARLGSLAATPTVVVPLPSPGGLTGTQASLGTTRDSQHSRGQHRSRHRGHVGRGTAASIQPHSDTTPHRPAVPSSSSSSVSTGAASGRFVVQGKTYLQVGPRIGRGGTSEVFRVLAEADAHVYALKRVDMARSVPEAVNNEITLLQDLQSDHVIRLVGAESSEDGRYTYLVSAVSCCRRQVCLQRHGC